MGDIDISRQIRVPVEDDFRPISGDMTYPYLLGDKSFNDDRSDYRFLSKYYRKPDLLPEDLTFSEYRSNNNFCKVAGTATPLGIISGGALGYAAASALHPILQSYLKKKSPIVGFIERAAARFSPTYTSQLKTFPGKGALAGMIFGGGVGASYDIYNFLNKKYQDQYNDPYYD